MRKLSKIIQDYLDGEKINSSKKIINQIKSKLLESGFSPPFKISSISPNKRYSFSWTEEDSEILSLKGISIENVSEILTDNFNDLVEIIEETDGIGNYEHFGFEGREELIRQIASPQEISINFSKLKDSDLIPYFFKVNGIEYQQTGKSVDSEIIAYYSGGVI